jgi:CHAT domain-containing protein
LSDEHARLLAILAQGRYRYQAPAKPAESLAGRVQAALGPSRVLVEYLVTDDRRRYATSYLGSSSQLVAPSEVAPAPPKRLFALANPAAGQTRPAAAEDDPLNRQLRAGAFGAALSPLPGAETEVRHIARLFPADSTTIVTGAAATEAAYESEAGRSAIVHIAAHGVASDGQPLYSTLVLAPDKTRDGFLQAFEVLRTSLRADLVVLGACETAVGGADWGQGLVGLVAALEQSGARSVVATLWSIDEATSELMAAYYTAMSRGSSTSSALRQAKLQMLQRRLLLGNREVSLAHPFFWAPFILVGTGPEAPPPAR